MPVRLVKRLLSVRRVWWRRPAGPQPGEIERRLAEAAAMATSGRHREALRRLRAMQSAAAITHAQWARALALAQRANAWPELAFLAKSALRCGGPYAQAFASLALSLRKMKRIRTLDRLHDHLTWAYRQGAMDVGAYINIMRAVQWREPLIGLAPALPPGEGGPRVDFVNAMVELARLDLATTLMDEWRIDASRLTEENRRALAYFEARRSQWRVGTFDQLLERLVDGLGGRPQRPCEPAPATARIRILFLASSLRVGGSERQLAYLLDGLDRRPDLYEVSLVVLFRSPNEIAFSRNNISVLYRDQLVDPPEEAAGEADEASLWADIEFGLRREKLIPLARHARRFRPDIVYHAVGMPTDAIVCGLACGAKGIVVRFGGMGFQNSHDASDVQRFHMRVGELCLSRLHHRLVLLTNSEAARQSWSRHLSLAPGHIAIVDNGTAFQPLLSAEQRTRKKAELFGTGDVTVIGFVGRFHEIKRPRLWINVALALAKAHPSARFLLVGDGSLRAAIQSDLRRSAYADRFVFTGEVGAGLHELYGAMDLLLLTSRTESLPNVVIEALGYGVYVVAGPVGDVPVVVQSEGHGAIVPGNDHDGFVAEVGRSIAGIDAIAARRDERARHARARFGIEKMRQRYMALFRRIAGRAYEAEDATAP